jgi:hypothetical protein
MGYRQLRSLILAYFMYRKLRRTTLRPIDWQINNKACLLSYCSIVEKWPEIIHHQHHLILKTI